MKVLKFSIIAVLLSFMTSCDNNYTCYLHFFAFRKIQNLDSFINLRVLYLENNSIEKIENLDKLNHLESLYLQNNYIINIENLDNNKELVNINLSSNKIKMVKYQYKLYRNHEKFGAIKSLWYVLICSANKLFKKY